MMARLVLEVSVAVWLLGVALGQQAADVPGAAWVTAAAGGLAVVAIAQAVRAISRTESQKTQVVEALQQELREAHEEIRELHAVLRSIAHDRDGD